MIDAQRNGLNVALAITIILYLHLNIIEAKKTKPECPIGYQLGLSKNKEKVCYYLKREPEPFSAKFVNCTGNIFTLKLYNGMSLPAPEMKLWTDYKSLYPGGPFVHWSHTESEADVLDTTYEVNRDPSLGIDEELCVAIDPANNFTAVRCDEMNYRYCFIEPYSDDTSDDGCESLSNGIRFWSPMQTCLTAVIGEASGGRGVVRATWNQAQRMCKKRGGAILGEGWRYSNYFKAPTMTGFSVPIYPLNVVMSANDTFLRYGKDNTSVVIPKNERHFVGEISTNDSLYLGAITNYNFWDLVNSSYIFYDVICERPVQLLHVDLTVTIDSGDELITLTVNDTLLQEEDIHCFTDSTRYYPQKVSIKPHPSDINVYILKAVENGYYWCTHIDSQNFYITESNKALYVKVKESTENLYAVRIRTFNDYKLDKISKLLENVWKKKLEEYVFYSTKYGEFFFEYGPYNNYSILNYKKQNPGLSWGDRNIIQKLKLKRLYLDARTALLHVELHPDMIPVMPGQWENIVIEYMKPVYYCDKERKLSLGMSYSTMDCKNITCVGDYNDGVQGIITPQEGCYTPVPTTLLRSINVSDITTPLPVKTTTPPATTDEVYLRDERSGSDSSEEWKKPIRVETTMGTVLTESSYEVSTFSNEVLTAVPTKPPVRPPLTLAPPPPITTTLPPLTTTPPVTIVPERPIKPPPDQQLQQVMDNLQDLLHNNSEPVLIGDISDAFTQVDELLDMEELTIPGNLLHLLDEIGARIDLNGSDDSSTVRENIALLVADAQPRLPVRGLRVAARDSDVFTNDTFEIIREDINLTQLSIDESEVVVALPLSVSTSNRRVSFVVFRNDRAFSTEHEAYFVNSRVLSVNIENTTQFHNGEVIDIHLMPITAEPERNQSRACAYWQFVTNVTGYWSQEGCTFIPSTEEGLLDTCRCDHLTHFAEVLIPRTVFSERNEAVLEVLTIVGCITSILGLLLVGLTAILFRSWRRDFSNKIWLQLCISIFLLSVCFLVIVFAKFQEHDILCTLMGVGLHYTVLASFCWMLVAAVLSYRRLVTVFTRDASHKLLRASAFAWGTPCAVVGILLSVDPQSYAGRYEDKSPSGAFCYPSGLALWLSVYTPIAIMLLANWTLFILIVRSVFASRRIQRHGDTNEALRCASVSCLLVFLFGLPWIFGLFSFNVVSAYFFTILVTFQGFVLFLFFVLGNKKTRDLWLNKLKIKRSKKVPVTSSTYTNRSTGANVPSRGNQTPVSIEAKASKPRSLSSLDNSRFS